MATCNSGESCEQFSVRSDYWSFLSALEDLIFVVRNFSDTSFATSDCFDMDWSTRVKIQASSFRYQICLLCLFFYLLKSTNLVVAGDNDEYYPFVLSPKFSCYNELGFYLSMEVVILYHLWDSFLCGKNLSLWPLKTEQCGLPSVKKKQLKKKGIKVLQGQKKNITLAKKSKEKRKREKKSWSFYFYVSVVYAGSRSLVTWLSLVMQAVTVGSFRILVKFVTSKSLLFLGTSLTSSTVSLCCLDVVLEELVIVKRSMQVFFFFLSS